MHRKYYILYLLLLVCAFTACTPRSLREAQSVVAQADSLWLAGKLYGVDEGDIAHWAGELPLDGEIERSFQKIHQRRPGAYPQRQDLHRYRRRD